MGLLAACVLHQSAWPATMGWREIELSVPLRLFSLAKSKRFALLS